VFNVVLFEPEIPSNTGAIGRTCVVTGARLHLIGPLGFSIDDRKLKRAGLAYWESLDVTVYGGWQDFLEKNGLVGADGSVGPESRARLHLLTKKARKTYADAAYREGDFLVFGKESAGLPEGLLADLPDCCERIPMLPDESTLENREEWEACADELGGGSSVTSHERLEQRDICGNFVDPDDYRISALNLANAASIVLYEALRQTGFAGMDA
jgi:tRNA (cytidine/uridine-2'-O-)-methyltransferase